MLERAVAYAVEPGQGETIQGPVGGPLTFKARGAQTGGELTLFENVIAPGDGPPLHTHASEDESWYVLEGHVRFRLGDELRDATVGSFVFGPRGTPHCFQNSGAVPARIIIIFTPSGMERFFDRFAALPQGSGVLAAFASIGRELGLEVVGPPLAISHPL
jgi:mannose-6-phosphate isomerase-like protein (cupin superfamily)